MLIFLVNNSDAPWKYHAWNIGEKGNAKDISHYLFFFFCLFEIFLYRSANLTTVYDIPTQIYDKKKNPQRQYILNLSIDP